MEAGPSSAGCGPEAELEEEEIDQFAGHIIDREYGLMAKFLEDHPDYQGNHLTWLLLFVTDIDDARAISIICSKISDINNLVYPDDHVIFLEDRQVHLLTRAFSGHRLNAARTLLLLGAGKNDRDALYHACRCSESAKVYPLISEMLRRGAAAFVNDKVDITCGLWDYPLHQAAIFARDASLIRLLIGAGADLEVVNYDGETPLAVAIRKGNYGTAKALIEAGAYPFALQQQYSCQILPPARRWDLVKLLHKARVDWLFKHYKYLYLMPELTDSQPKIKETIWNDLYSLLLHPKPNQTK